MERRSRSTTRTNPNVNGYGHGHGHHHDFGSRQSSGRGYPSLGTAGLASASSSGGADPVVPPPSLTLRPGGDARTLSPDRRSSRHLLPEAAPAANKAGSYNHYTMRQPPASLIVNGSGGGGHPHGRPSLPHLSPSGPPPPRPPPASSSPPRTTSTPQSTPVRYEDFAEGLNGSKGSPYKSANGSLSSSAGGKHPSPTATTTVREAPAANLGDKWWPSGMFQLRPERLNWKKLGVGERRMRERKGSAERSSIFGKSRKTSRSLQR